MTPPGDQPGFVPPPYPYDRLRELEPLAAAHEGGVVDLSIGTPCDAPPAFVLDALSSSGTERGYPASIGSPAYRDAAAGWLERRLGVTVAVDELAACIGTKEFVAGLPHWLRLRDPSRDTVLYPAISYPSYAMGATLAGARAVPVPPGPDGAPDLDAISADDASRALCLWVNVPGNPTGAVTDLGPAAAWGRAHGVPVASDECYVEFTWQGPRRTILEHGTDGVLAVHSLSKRSNLAGVRAGFYAGDAELVHYLSELRKHAGFMVPGPVQAAAVAAWRDDAHVDEQCGRYLARLDLLADTLCERDILAARPDGAFYLWVAAPDGDAWGLARRLAAEGGALVSPGEFYGPQGAGFVRIAAVQPDDRLELLARRLRGVG
ncbi:aminotransferase class I/II-fold pyridoxal phosphate-dependent enzyme [Rhabdothermincola salaria]|uniref:aminotransferase class I/II-fold pyridoxal phosphate-dependent enzyme n=1 Tax=Rhabdothermincola salaria TaxID=2903142 RepID=UPI001E46CE19|nr:aminotransferase class I/II-fold pyridoxal phosphate-dependent enzyme [Rhabdothermincola salaria]MCD9624882.1 aminotransferase class I/II-fold pyridoxal phosphate-dependent enzyme [Rhabdothermincola salaria]